MTMLLRSLIGMERMETEEICRILEAYIADKLRQIAEVEQLVERYEKKRSAEERAYRQMTPLRRLLSGRKPDHHLAVEYIHYVKKPLERVRQWKAEVETARALLKDAKSGKRVTLPEDMEKELT